MHKLYTILFALLFFTATAFAQTETVVGIIVNSTDHNTLEAAVIAAGLDDDLSGEGPFTVFAPTDNAFAALPDGTVEALLADSATLANILLYHVAGLEAFSTDLTDGQRVMTLQGGDVVVTINDEGVFINDAEVTVANIQALNGVVHVINAVMVPVSVATEEPAFAEDVRILPNPSSTVSYVELPQEIIQSTYLRLLDMNGGVLVQRKARATVEAFDVSSLASGTYLLQIQANAGTAYRRIVVQR